MVTGTSSVTCTPYVAGRSCHEDAEDAACAVPCGTTARRAQTTDRVTVLTTRRIRVQRAAPGSVTGRSPRGPEPADQVRLAVPGPGEGERVAVVATGGAEQHLAGQQDRLAERDLGGHRVRQPAFERGEAAGLAPHAVRDLPGEPERLGGQRVQVDRVVVPGHRRVAPAEVAAEPPRR